MIYYEVLTATKNKTNKLLTYACDEHLERYQIVRVPVRQQTCMGLVISKAVVKTMNEDLKTKCRPITEVSPYCLPESLVQAVLKLCQVSALSLSGAAQLLLSNAVMEASRQTTQAGPKATEEAIKPLLNPDQNTVHKKIVNKQTMHPQLIFGVNGSGKTRIYAELINDQMKLGRSALILVPEIGLSAQVLELLRNYLPYDIDHFHSRLSPKQKRNLWEKCQTCTQPVIVVGPRSAEFLPFKNLGLIVLDEFHDDSFKQEKQPAYHSLQLASLLAETCHAKVICGSATPRIEDYYRFQQARYPIYHLEKSALPRVVHREITIVDKRQLKENFSQPALDGIITALKTKNQALIFHNRRGHWRVAKCYQCLWQAECPSCQRNLIFHHDKFKLICHGCGQVARPLSACPQCRQAITYTYPGLKLVTDELARHLAARNLNAPIWRFDSDNLKHESLVSKFEQIKDQDSLVILGTQIISQGLDILKLQTVVILDADQSLVSPDYRSQERYYQHIHQLSGRVGRGHLEKAEVIIQTHQPDNPVLKHAVNQDWLSFYEEEIIDRRNHELPPFVHFANISIRRSSQEATKTAATKLHQELAMRFKDIQLYQPAPALIEKHPRYWEWLIHASCRSRKPLLEMADFFKDKDYFFNLDPNQLFAGEN